MRNLIQKVRYFIKRFVLYPHNKIILRNLKRGEWYDNDTQMFEAMFEILRKYVEEECAWMEVLMGGGYTNWDRFRQRWFPYSWRKEDARMWALNYLDWEIGLVSETDQSKKAKIVKELYLWYMDEYPNLKDPYDMIDNFEFRYIDSNGNPTNEAFPPQEENAKFITMNTTHPDYKEALRRSHLMEIAQMTMIDKKLEKLLKIRRSMWT